MQKNPGVKVISDAIFASVLLHTSYNILAFSTAGWQLESKPPYPSRHVRPILIYTLIGGEKKLIYIQDRERAELEDWERRSKPT